MWHFVLLAGCAIAIYLSCEWFVNAVEWLGRRLNVGRMAVGTILAAFGTALPESVVTLVAVTTGGSVAARNVGVGAAMGGPLVLATVAYGITGFALLLKRRDRAPQLVLAGVGTGGGVSGDVPPANPPGQHGSGQVLAGPAEISRLVKDQRWFLAIFVVKVGLGLVAFAIKPWLGVLFFATYGVYFWREMRAGGGDDEAEALAPLKLQRRAAKPATWAVAIQTLGSLAVIFLASELFVAQLDAIGPVLGISGAVTALLLAPIATELPEIMNAIIWVRQGKTQLALANISGAMMIQATVPSALGLLFTDWQFGPALILSGAVTMVAIGYLLSTLRAGKLTAARLASTGLLYVAFGLGLVAILA